MKSHQSRPTTDPARPTRRAGALTAACLGAAAVLAACGGNSSPSSSAARPASAASTGSCAGVAGAHHARVVVETSPSSLRQQCVGFATPTITAAALLSDARVALGTQKYSFGVAICQVDGVPAHYSQCLPSGQPYWALFVSRHGAAWTSASAGISDTTLAPGDSLGLRYDSPTGNPAPPPAPTPA